MIKYQEQKQELDKQLEKLISIHIKNKSLKILDACCGIGYLSNMLSKISPKSQVLGIDQTPFLIEYAKKNIENKKISFEIEDIYKLSKKYRKYFDVTINWKTISWLPYYEEIIEELFKVTKKKIFLSSLFYEGDIDFEIKVREFKKESGKEKFNLYYNVYSLPRFQRFLSKLGAKNVEVHDFDIDLDLVKPPIDQMGTYTQRLDDGKRLQISETVIMNWKIIQIDLD